MYQVNINSFWETNADAKEMTKFRKIPSIAKATSLSSNHIRFCNVFRIRGLIVASFFIVVMLTATERALASVITHHLPRFH